MVYVVGHRGAAGVLPENTVKGFRYAVDLGCDYVECDVHLTRDDRLVVMHDESVDRTTNGTGALRDLYFANVRRLDAGDGENVPTLHEVLAVTKGRAQLLCELKGEGVEEAAVDAVLAHNMAGEVVFTSFFPDRIRKVKMRHGKLRIGAIFSNPTDDDIPRAVDWGVEAVGVHYKNLRMRTVELALSSGIQIRAWNPDTLREQKAMIGLGVSGVSTNRPDILLEYLRRADDSADV
jgi:glycerophosphoryl diester phosphodiesterase